MTYLQAWVHVEFLSSAITGSYGDAEVDHQFGHDCYLYDEEWALFCHGILRDSTITRDEAGVRVAVHGIFLQLHAWFNGRELGTMDCSGARLNYLCQDLIVWLLFMTGSVLDYKDFLVHGWGR